MTYYYTVLFTLFRLLNAEKLCTDKSPYCNLNDCAVRPGYALVYCRRTCGECGDFCQNSIYVSCKQERKAECDHMLKDYCPILCDLCKPPKHKNVSYAEIVEQNGFKGATQKYSVYDKDSSMFPTPMNFVVRKGPNRSSGQTRPIERSKEVELNTKIPFVPDVIPRTAVVLPVTKTNKKKTKKPQKTKEKMETTPTSTELPTTLQTTTQYNEIEQSQMRYQRPGRKSFQILTTSDEPLPTTEPESMEIGESAEGLTNADTQGMEDEYDNGVELHYGTFPESPTVSGQTNEPINNQYSTNEDVMERSPPRRKKPSKVVAVTEVDDATEYVSRPLNNPYFVHHSNRIGGDRGYWNTLDNGLFDAAELPSEPITTTRPKISTHRRQQAYPIRHSSPQLIQYPQTTTEAEDITMVPPFTPSPFNNGLEWKFNPMMSPYNFASYSMQEPVTENMNYFLSNPKFGSHGSMINNPFLMQHAPVMKERNKLYQGVKAASNEEDNTINPLGLTDLITLLGCRDRDPATCSKISEETCYSRPGYYLKLCPVKCRNCNGLLCYDSVKIDCGEVKERGGCKLPSAQEYCPRTCELCPNTPAFLDSLTTCKDELETCEHLAKSGVCDHPYSVQALRTYCAKSCGFCKDSMFYMNDLSAKAAGYKKRIGYKKMKDSKKQKG